MPMPLAPILPTPPEVSIVTSARSFPVEDLADGFADGVHSRDDFCLPVAGWPRCPDEDTLAEGKIDPDEPDFPEFQPWTIYVPVVCTGKVDDKVLFRSARESLTAKVPYAVARELWTGEHSGSASLQTTAVDIGGSPTSAPAAASALIGNFHDATGGVQAVLHVPDGLMDQLYESGMVSRVGNRLLTPTGDIVVPGPGYPSNAGAWGPLASSSFAESDADQAWMYVTGPVELKLGDRHDESSGEQIPGPTFARLNKTTMYAEQDAIFRFPVCAVFAALAIKAA